MFKYLRRSRTTSNVQAILDKYFGYTTLLLNGETQSDSFATDASTNSLQISPVGSVRNDLFSPFNGDGNYSVAFNGSTDYFQLPFNSAYVLNSASSFTVECWVNLQSAVASTILSMRDGTGSTAGWEVGTYAANPQIPQISWDGAGKTGLLGTTNIALNTWTHLAFTYDGTTLRYFKNGVMESSATSIVTSSAASQNLFIGLAKYTGTAIRFFPGNISNVRIVKGTAVYIANFTPSTSGLTAIANTSLLCCQSASFKDNSTNNFVLTVGGSQKVSPLAPFSYTPAAASGYFGGNGNYLATLSSSSFNVSSTTSVWTAECWVYPVASGYVFSIGNGGTFGNAVYLQWGMSSAQTFTLGQGNGSSANTISIITSANYPANAWYHVAITKDASGVRKVYVNGALAGTQTAAGAGVAVASGLVVNGAYDNNGIGNNGGSAYVSNLRFVNGTAVYTANFTPPTVPLTAITNTALLTLQNAGPANNIGFLDSSVNDLVLTRNGTPTQGTFSPFSQTGWSALFNGTTDWAQVSINSALDLGSGDFTVEFWFNTPVAFSGATTSGFLGKKLSDTTNGWQIYKDSGTPTKMNARIGLTNNFFSATTPTVGVWQHWALVRSGTTVSWYVNGVLDSTTTNSVNVSDTTGAFNVGYADTWAFYGNFGISNLRIVKGTAVYTTNFTPSTTPLTAITNTVLLAFQSNRIVDNSSGALPLVTHAGSPTIQATSPFEPTSAYTASVNGGSMYLNGTTDWLTTSAVPAFGSGNWTIEAWINTGVVSTAATLIDFRTTAQGWYPAVFINASYQPYFYVNAAFAITSSVALSQNQWYHFALVKANNVTTMYLNGTPVGSYGDANTYLGSTGMTIGASGFTGDAHAYKLTGYVSNLRIVSGTSVYQAFTAPTVAYPNTSTNDPYFNQVSLLLHGDGANGQQNKTFVDSSTNALTITATGTPTQGTFTPFENNGWSTYFNGTTDSLATPTSVNNGLGTVFTAEAWIYPTSFAGGPDIMDNRTGNECGYWGVTTSGLMVTTVTSPSVLLTSGTAVSLNAWSHVAIASDANGMRMYINGVLTATTSTQAVWPTTTRSYLIGYAYGGGYYFSGSMSNVRVVKGTAVYTGSSFTVPTVPLTAVTGTSFLVCQSSRFVDTSSNAVVLTATGTPSVQANSPFAVTTAYSAAVNGGSMYFNGSTDYITTPSNALFNFGTSGNFTVEAWIYTTTSLGANWYSILDHADSASSWYGWQFGASNNTFEFSTNSGTTTGLRMAASTTFQPNTWNHLAVVRSGTTFTMFQNGLSVATATSSLNFDQTIALVVGRERQGTYYFPGYVSNSRIVNGTALYTANFTPPTAPLTAIANTALLLSGTNGVIVDSTGKNDIITVGSAQVSTSVVKYGTGSMYFNGTTDYVITPASSSFTLSSGDFTIEAWIYPLAYGSSVCGGNIFGTVNGTQAGYSFNLGESQTRMRLISNGTGAWADNLVATTGPALNTWSHVALTRKGNLISIFVNGAVQGTTTVASTFNLTGTVGTSGYFTEGTNPRYINGYIDDLRVTKGVARYPSNFTVPSLPLTAIANTQLLLSGTNPGIANAAASSDLITAGSASTSSVQKKFGSKSLYFNGTTDYLTSPSSTANAFSGNFTMEAWIYPTASGTSRIVSFANADEFLLLPANTVSYYDGTTNFTTTATVTLNTWSHVAVAKVGTRVSVYINGVQGVTGISTYTTTAARVMTIGRYGPSATNYFTGYIDDLRVTNGVARYTGGFTVATAALPDNSVADPYFNQVSLLLHADGGSYTAPAFNNNVIVDSSANAFTLIRTGTPTQGTFSPFAAVGSTAYSPAVNGGSMYFNGSTDYFSVPYSSAINLTSGNWTIECWVYFTTISNGIIYNKDGVFNASYSQYGLGLNGSGKLIASIGNGNGLSPTDTLYTGTTTIVANTWYHIALVMNGSTVTLYLNGVVEASGTQLVTMVDGGKPLIIGYQTGQSAASYFPGYISNFRIVKGTAVYTAAFTPSTAPLAIVGNTTLLLSGVGAGIIDGTGKNDVVTVGTAKTQSAVVKYGTGAMSFNGTTDYLATSSGNFMAFGTGDFTVEFWVYPTALSATNGPILIDNRPTGTNGAYFCIPCVTRVPGTYVNNANQLVSNTALALNVWTHLAVVRANSVITMYLNGTSVASMSDTNSYLSSNQAVIGAASGTLGVQPLSGYIDDFRVTKGYARYTAAFTPPTAALPNSSIGDAYFAYTSLLLQGDLQQVTTTVAKNNVFVDSSANALAITPTGNPTQGTFSPFDNSGFSTYFGGVTNTYLQVANTGTTFDFGNDTALTCIPFTAEGWFNIATYATRQGLINHYTNGGQGWNINVTTTGFLSANFQGDSATITGTTPVTLNTWHHFAISGSDHAYGLYLDGVLQATQTAYSDLGNSTTITIGQLATASTITGYMSNVRIVKGTAVYSGTSFAVPTAPLTAVAGTALLTLQDYRFKDNSTNAFALTVTGAPSIQAKSPFAVSTYNPAVNGGSMYFNGTTDYVKAAVGAGLSGNYTIEAFVYLTGSSGMVFGSFGVGTDYISVSTSGINLGIGSNYPSWAATIGQNQWHHFAIVKNGTYYYAYLDGLQLSGGNTAGTNIFSTGTIGLGSYYSGANNYFSGYISNARIVNGTALYTGTTYTVPTAPLTAITNTSLLLNSTAVGVTDNSGTTDVVLVGAATVGSNSKFGSGALTIPNGSTDFAYVPGNNPNMVLGTGDFTIEFWYYQNVLAAVTLLDFRPSLVNGAYINIGVTATGAPSLYVNTATQITSTTLVPAATWAHLAISRVSGITRMFVNGILVGTYTDATNYLSGSGLPVIGANSYLLSASTFGGAIDDLRITKGVGRYTGNFTVPTAALPTN